MPDDTPVSATGFRSLVEQIQAKDGPVTPEYDRGPGPRRRPPMRRDTRAERGDAAPAPAPRAPQGIVRLLERRWL